MSNEKKRSIKFLLIVIFIIFFLIFIFFEKLNKFKRTYNDKEETIPKKGYEIKFNDTFNKALANQDDLGLSILIAVDCSGSMGDFTKTGTDNKKKYVLASESLAEIINFFYEFYNTNIKNENIKLKIGLIKFSADAEIIYELTEINDKTFSQLKNITADSNNFLPKGSTAIGKTLAKGAEILAQSGTIFKSLIIITDGENTEGIIPETVLDAIVNNKNNKNSTDFPVLTNNIIVSFIGFDINMTVFDELGRIGSRITKADDKNELNASLKNLFLADITKLESK